jgi:hypothetical protein
MAAENEVGRLLELREELLRELARADLEFSRVRMQVERLESDLRIGRPAPPEYAELKGRTLPRAEGEVLDLYRQLTKLEDRINSRSGR